MKINLLLIREDYSGTSTIGRLLINIDNTGWIHECYILEDVVRTFKIPGRTAIPSGIYKVIINFSGRFQKDMPLILNVPNYSGVRIHSGNTDKDTEGCLLTGLTKGHDIVYTSREAFENLFGKLKQADDITIEVIDTKQIV